MQQTIIIYKCLNETCTFILLIFTQLLNEAFQCKTIQDSRTVGCRSTQITMPSDGTQQ